MVRAAVGGSASAWRQRLRRHSQSGLTVTAFCSKEKVSVASFYAWKKRLSVDPGMRAERPSETAGPVFRAISLVKTTPVISARLPGGMQLEVGVADPDLIRAVVGELVRADQAAATGESPC